MVPLFILMVTLAADQVSKALVRTNMHPGQSVPDLGVFRLTYVTNSGSAFGLFPNQTFLLIIASFVGIGVLLLILRAYPGGGSLLTVSLGLQLGGATGNLVDRIRLGYVVDFIDVGWWPVFNLADSAIVVGLTTLLWIIVSTKESAIPGQETAEDSALYLVMAGERNAAGGELENESVNPETLSNGDESTWEKSAE
jgi:signal peptidase II